MMVGSTPMTSNVTSAPRPSVRSRTAVAGSVSAALTVWVAPKLVANSSFESNLSIATIVSAPAILEPWMTLRPTPPQPRTATVSPLRMLAVFVAAPTPVSTAQLIRAATFIGTSAGTATALISGMTVSSAKVPSMAICRSGTPSRPKRGVPSSKPPVAAIIPSSHR
jgi:hypothetical protein